jgi:hypothetical protein
MVYDSIKNTNPNDPNLSSDQTDTPYLLKNKTSSKKICYKFSPPTTFTNSIWSRYATTDVNEEVTPNADNVGLGLPFEKDKLTAAYSPKTLFLQTLMELLPQENFNSKIFNRRRSYSKCSCRRFNNLSNSQVNFQVQI